MVIRRSERLQVRIVVHAHISRVKSSGGPPKNSMTEVTKDTNAPRTRPVRQRLAEKNSKKVQTADSNVTAIMYGGSFPPFREANVMFW